MLEAIEIAQNEIGTKEENNKVKYFTELFPKKKLVPWCLPFIEWVFDQAYGEDQAVEMLCLPDREYITSVPALVTIMKYNNRWYKAEVRMGWLAFFRANLEWTNHVELVIDVTDDEITTIGGNYGGEVKQNTYSRDDIRIAGYGEIEYSDNSSEDSEDSDV